MRVVLGLSSFAIGGTESYVLTVAEHLDRLGHTTAIYTAEPGRGAELARERGMPVIGAGELEDYDAALVQDGAASLEIAASCPHTPQVFVGHSENFDPQLPPQLADVVATAVAMNDRVRDRLASVPVRLEVLRLRQPIDTERFVPRGPLPRRPRRALMLSNNHFSDRQEMLESACEAAGIELVRIGGSAGQSSDPRSALAAADIVIGYGRSILEAMACGRAAYVYDWAGGNGWITPETYAGIEADGFAGRSEPIIDGERLAEDLHRYSAEMGPVNRDLVNAHHRANLHAQELVELMRRLSPRAQPIRAPLEEMARLVRLEWRARSEVHAQLGEAARLREELNEMREESNEMREELNETHERVVGVEAERARAIHDVTRSFERSASWRMTRPLRVLGSLLRLGGQMLGAIRRRPRSGTRGS